MNKKKFFFFIFFYFLQILSAKETNYNLYIDLNIQIYSNNKKKILTNYQEYTNKVFFFHNNNISINNLFDYKKTFLKTKKNKIELLIYFNEFSETSKFKIYYDHLSFNSKFNIQLIDANVNLIKNKTQSFKCSVLFLYFYRIKNFFSFFSLGSGFNYNIFISTMNNFLLENNILNTDSKHQSFYQQRNIIVNKFSFFYILSICIFSYKNHNYIINLLYELENNIKIDSFDFFAFRKHKFYNFCLSAKYYIT